MSAPCIAITGGCGYIGRRLALALLERDNVTTVRLLDIRCDQTNDPTMDNKRLEFCGCDLRSYEHVEAALSNVTCVYHLASYGMSGREMLNKSMISEVNIIGTKNVIDACIKHGIEKLIYCSTYNAVYTGKQELVGVTEDQCSYPREDEYCDDYSRTKSLAEQAIINASTSKLATAAIRPAAIYGDGEERHLPRIIKSAQQGLLFFAVGHENVLCDWVYADNLVHALVLAEKSLPEHSGQAYFISDDKPVNNFEFISKFTNGLGYKNCFRFYLPTWLMFYLSHIVEITHNLLSRYIYDFTPFFTRAEVLKVGVTHYANITKAKKLLHYRVLVSPDEAMQRCVQWFAEHGYSNTAHENSSTRLWLILISLVILMLSYWYQFLR